MAFHDPDAVTSPRWSRFVPGGNGRLGAHLRGDKWFDTVEENWARPKKYVGEPTVIVPLVSMAGETWAISYREVTTVPKQLALELIAAKRARLARDSEIPDRDE